VVSPSQELELIGGKTPRTHVRPVPAVIAEITRVRDQVPPQEFCPELGGGVRNEYLVEVVLHPLGGKKTVVHGYILNIVIRLADDDAADDDDVVVVQVVDCLPAGLAYLALVHERQVLRGDVFNAQKHDLETGPRHLLGDAGAGGDASGAGLNEVLHVVTTGPDDFFAEGLESSRLERDVVVDKADDVGAELARAANILNHAGHGVLAVGPAVHALHAAEVAPQRAPARGLHHFRAPEDVTVALPEPVGPRGHLHLAKVQEAGWFVMNEPAVFAVADAPHAGGGSTAGQRIQKQAKGPFPLAPDQEVEKRRIRSLTQLAEQQRRMVSAQDDLHAGIVLAHDPRDVLGGVVLERHGRKPDEVGLDRLHCFVYAGGDILTAATQVGHDDLVAGRIGGQRA